MKKTIIIGGMLAALCASLSHSQLLDYAGYRYDLVGNLKVNAKLINCKPLKHAPQKTITVRNQIGNSKISISFLDSYNVKITNDDAGKGLSDPAGGPYLPTNYVVQGSVFDKNGKKLKISRRNDNVNYNDGAQSLLAIYNEDTETHDFFNIHNYEQGADTLSPIYNRLLRWRVRTALGYLPDDSLSNVDNNILQLLNHKYTPKKFSMDMILNKNRTATLKEILVAETTFAVPTNSYLPSGACTIRLTSKRTVKSAPGTFAIPL